MFESNNEYYYKYYIWSNLSQKITNIKGNSIKLMVMPFNITLSGTPIALFINNKYECNIDMLYEVFNIDYLNKGEDDINNLIKETIDYIESIIDLYNSNKGKNLYQQLKVDKPKEFKLDYKNNNIDDNFRVSYSGEYGKYNKQINEINYISNKVEEYLEKE